MEVDRSSRIQHAQVPDGLDNVIDRGVINVFRKIDNPTYGVNVMLKQ